MCGKHKDWSPKLKKETCVFAVQSDVVYLHLSKYQKHFPHLYLKSLTFTNLSPSSLRYFQEIIGVWALGPFPSPPHHHLQKGQGPCRAAFPPLQRCQGGMVRHGEDDGAGDGLHRLLPSAAALVMAHPDEVLQITQPADGLGWLTNGG